MHKADMGQVYDEYAQTVYKYLLYLTKSAALAEELTQETFYRAVKNVGKFKGDCKISTWLCQIAKYVWYQHLDKQNKKKTVEINEMALASGDVEEAFLSKEGHVHMLKQMQALPPLPREVVYLRTMGGLSFREIGEVLGNTENWARVTFYRAKQKLWEEWSEDGTK